MSTTADRLAAALAAVAGTGADEVDNLAELEAAAEAAVLGLRRAEQGDTTP